MKTILLLLVMFSIGSRATAAQPTIELRGVMVGVGPTKFSLLDKTNETTRWVEVGQTFAGYKVTAYDTATESITLNKDGAELRLRLSTATVREAPTDTVPVPAEVTRAVLNNLRQISAAADQYYMETGRTTVALADLVGTDKYIKQLKPVDGESYNGLQLRVGAGPLEVKTAHGVGVSYAP